MPRTAVELEYSVEYLSILDENGDLDTELEPDIEDDQLHKMFRTMLLSRRFDERLLTLQRQGRIGTFAPVKGQEACQIGSMPAMRDSDWFLPAFREFAAMIWRGFPLAEILVFAAGYNEGAAIPEDAHDFPIAVPVASQIPHAVGVAYACQYRESDDVAIVFFGDGATSEGDFHEAMNFAGVLGSPVVFLCQDNRWAISLPRDQQSKSKTLAQKGLAYGMPCLQVDGNDILAVYAATAEAVERARNGDGPTMIECLTYRLAIHTTADDPSKYRDEEEVEKWEKLDPLPRFQNYMVERELLSDDDIDTMEDEIKDEIDQAWKDAESKIEELGGPEVMFDYVYAERPPYLEAQRQTFLELRDREEG
ncbi:pyruvate dehydrogenase (acetyl-transferring) E1 component subunit alpha [Salinisphaera sp.]|uniref:pyruvate dehydrogenase (acetyl-transferring) E1 component subunit alpha n=1 Tax=Salinisphaera sp. TaxID=1914330 RepID=UPI002D7980FA|nr:pyruvate dehydrogenase (acetyl-transferring) E1 component subunit alpha [Salinisphaera sp.]HET7315389.1 pyruvate dehydrogenase (acetyl-transferring) E1 component subunit alpha [Salinisphaera sp.]